MPRKNEPISATEALQQASAARPDARYVFSLYVTGTSPASARALVNIRKLCDAYLPGRYELQIVDLTKHPQAALSGQVVAAPTLIKQLPLPVRRFIGDMSRAEKILVGLDLAPASPPAADNGK